MIIDLSKEKMEMALDAFLDRIFALPEIESAKVRDVVISREDKELSTRKAFEAGYHDCYSDVDLSVKVCLPKDGSITPEAYMKRIDRFGITQESALGYCFVPENCMYRIILKNGMRYDYGFEFEFVEDAALTLEERSGEKEDNPNWPMENINRFWFVQIQALAKLYRKDYLISSHLANVNCNETLVMQMVLRDLQYGTNHHRYGHSEALEYVKYLDKAPFQTEDPTFNRIADHLYAAALAYDRLAMKFYPEYQSRCGDFMKIWDCYHKAQAYVCKIASLEELKRKWDYEITQNPGDGNWLIWKEEAVENFQKGVSIPYYGILNGTIICEATAVTDPQCVQNSEGMMEEGAVYLCAFRTNSEYQGQGYFSKLKDFMLEDLRKRGFTKAILGVAVADDWHQKMYEHWGFTEYLKTGAETYPDETIIDVEYFGKELRNIVEKMRREIIRRSDLFEEQTKGTKDEYNLYREHVQYVYKYAVMLSKDADVDKEVVELSALLHDISMTDMALDRSRHNEFGSAMAEQLLREQNYPEEKTQLVAKCILNHSSKRAQYRTTQEEELLVCADGLAHFDAYKSLYSLAHKVMGLNDEESLKFIQDKLTKDYAEIREDLKSLVDDTYARVMNAKTIGEILHED
ncbi:MAG: GNAT family N-acetyltransferase [Acetatifactor sp.]|nr:GNAT family N-acetyltransferase [Acetatifactor sp.]